MPQLTNKIALVTGSTAGIGKASALALAAEGATVIVSGRRAAEGQAVVDEITETGGKATFIAADVTQPDQVAALFSQAIETVGDLDIVFLNSGIYHFAPLAEQTAEDLALQLDVNVKGLYYGVQESARRLKPGSSVILNSSTVADIGMPGASAYTMTKGAVNSLVAAAAVELAPQGIRVNAISPGPIWTEGMGEMMGSRENAEANLGGLNVMGRVGEPEEIASGVVFLGSDASSFITGQILRIDGGIHIK
ncbi:MAG: SDR family oxidoreductase [Armatimonadetes bacterium]|nr:SDR family oxidoreductase [Armatimonadota bacterium]